MKEVNCDSGELYGAYKYDEMIRLRDNKNCGLILNDDQEEIVNRFSELFKLDELDILKQNYGELLDQEYNKDKIPLLVSDKQNIPLVYKGNNDLFYFDPLTLKKYFEKEQPTIYLRRKVKEDKKKDEMGQIEPSIILRDNSNNKKNNKGNKNQFNLYVIGIVVVIAIILLIYFMLFK